MLGAGGKPLARVCVLASGPAGTAAALTSATGQYALTGLRAGSYVLAYRPCGAAGRYLLQWSGGASQAAAARPLAVAGSGARRLAPVTLRTVRRDGTGWRDGTGRRLGSVAGQPGTHGRVPAVAQIRTGGIAGRVTGPSGRPLRGICVTALGRGFGIGIATTRSGRYKLRFGLPPGPVRDAGLRLQQPVPAPVVEGRENQVRGGRDPPAPGAPRAVTSCRSNCGGGSFAPQFYRGAGIFEAATPVPVPASATITGISAVMPPGATISGSVTGRDGRKLSGICVSVTTPGVAREPAEDVFPVAGVASRHGRYQLRNLAAGQYAIQFSIGCGGTADLAQQWYRAQPTGRTATLVTTTLVALTSTAGHQLSNVCVIATQLGTGAGPPLTFAGQGSYTMAGLAPGRYRVEFSDCIVGGRYANQWFPRRDTRQAAGSVRVTGGHTTAGVNGVLKVGGSISGQVTERASGKPVAGACIENFGGPAGSESFTLSHRDGSYRLGALSAGSYRLDVQMCDVAGPDPAGPDLASQVLGRTVRVALGQAVTGVSARLAAGGSVSGVVSGGSPPRAQPGICVSVLPARGDGPGSFATAGPGGQYLATGLAAGTYQVLFGASSCEDSPPGLVPQWFRDKPTRAAATRITVSAGATTKGISATLAPDGTISGTVTGPGGRASTGTCVVAVPLAGSQPVLAISRSGRYTATVAPGRYKVEFRPGCGASGFGVQWWKGAASRSAARVITVPARAEVTGVSARLARFRK